MKILNKGLVLEVSIKNGRVMTELLEQGTGDRISSGPYRYFLSIQEAQNRVVSSDELDEVEAENSKDRITLRGKAQGLKVIHTFLAPVDENYIEESIILQNPTSDTLHIDNLAFGMTRPLTAQTDPNSPHLTAMINSEVASDRWVAIPFRRGTLQSNGEYNDFNAKDLLLRQPYVYVAYRFNEHPIEERQTCYPMDAWASEAWAWVRKAYTLLTLKYSQETMELSQLAVIPRGIDRYLQFGGVRRYRGNPEILENFVGGSMVRFGVTLYQRVAGGWQEAYYEFRRFMESRGHRVPLDFNPPIHWNELYDNKLWWGPNTAERRRQFYSRKAMLEEAAKARAYGCEALYLDPGWDTAFASSIWDEARLGPQEEFVKLLREEYGLNLSLHTPLAFWCDSSSYPREADRLDSEGRRLEGRLCSGSTAYRDEKRNRLLKLVREGATFLMFDGSAWTGPCYDPKHGHLIPYTREEQARVYQALCYDIHDANPRCLIELHDVVVGGIPFNYTPVYYKHGPGGHDEIWGWEYMWRSMEDLLKGHAISLYYYNLAYSLPLYLHVDLRTDNIHCIVFWWYASTCRHIGVGGTHPDPNVVAAQKNALQIYKGLKKFYSQGVFYGLGEDVHVHVLPSERSCVINVFNLSNQHVEKEVIIKPNELGLPPPEEFMFDDSRVVKSGPAIIYDLWMEPYSHQLLRLFPHTAR